MTDTATTVTCTYTQPGGVFVVPNGVTSLDVTAVGASGGNVECGPIGFGGAGASVEDTAVPVSTYAGRDGDNTDSALAVVVGTPGGDGLEPPGAGGSPGGGAGGPAPATGCGGGGGGGNGQICTSGTCPGSMTGAGGGGAAGTTPGTGGAADTYSGHDAGAGSDGTGPVVTQALGVPAGLGAGAGGSGGAAGTKDSHSGGGGGGGGGGSSFGITGLTNETTALTGPSVTISYQIMSLSVPAGGTAGTAIAAGAAGTTLAESGDAAGTISFTVFGPQPSPPADCTSGGTAVGTAAVSGPAPYTDPVHFNPPHGLYSSPAGFTPASAGTYWWHASYSGDGSDSGCGAGMAATVVTPPPPPDLSLAGGASPSPVVSGKQLTYTLKVTSTGGQAANGTTVTDQLPASTHFVSATAGPGTCTGPGTSKGGTVTCNTGNPAGSATATVTIVVTPTTPAVLTDTAAVTAANVTADNDDNATVTTTVTGT